MEKKYNILEVCSHAVFADTLSRLAQKSGADRLLRANCIREAEKLIMTNDISAVITDCPLSDGFGLDFAVKCAVTKNLPTLVFVKKELSEAVHGKLAKTPILILEKPTSSEIIAESLTLMEAMWKKLSAENEKGSLPDTANQIKLINKAKLILISSHGMTEAQAHKYIEKRAMEERKTKTFIARTIITSYGY